MARTHIFRTRVAWTGSTEGGSEAYKRDHLGTTPPATREVMLSADAAFGGDSGRTNPEQLLALAVSSCHLLTFLAIAANSHVEVLSYEDDAEAEMPEREKPIWIERILLRPKITVRETVSDERVLRLLEKTLGECYVSNSIKSEITVLPEVVRVAMAA